MQAYKHIQETKSPAGDVDPVLRNMNSGFEKKLAVSDAYC